MDGRPMRVLLIEDSPGDARLIREMLGEAPGASFAVEHADRLSAGLERLAAGGFDLVLLDLGLPDAQGLETLVKTHERAPQVPIVVLTGLDDEGLTVQAVQEGAQDYLVKGQIESGPLARAVRYAIERNQVERALRESEERLRTVVANAPVVLFSIGRDGVFWLSEGKGLGALGLRPGEAVGRSVFDLYSQVPEILHNVRRALGGEAFTSTVELDDLAFETHYAPIRDLDGTVSGIIGVATDITERARAEEALRRIVEDLEQKTQELESFTYSVSHDLKEPLRTLEAFSQFLLEDYAERLDDQGRDYLTRMSKASARLKQMIEELLILSRVGRRPQEPVRVDVGQVVASIAAGLQATVDERGARVEIEEGLPPVLGDRARVEQIFGNLMANGLKFNCSGEPTAEVGVDGVKDGMVIFSVRDNGIGIDPQYHEQVFGVFQRLHRREDYEGTGAGLAIVRRAVEALGGRVWLKSEPGDGTTFFVALPLWPAGAGAVPPLSAAGVAASERA